LKVGRGQVEKELPAWTLATPTELAAVLAYYPTLADGTCIPDYTAGGEMACCALAEKVMRDAVFTCPAWRLIVGSVIIK
jgi:hypothetical protein